MIWAGTDEPSLVKFNDSPTFVTPKELLVYEKRRHHRVPLEAVVTCRSTEVDAESFNCEAHARDISIGGMYLQSDAPPPLGRKLELSFQLPGNSLVLHLPAIVRWFGVDGFGVQFQLLGAKETHAITRYTQ
jgi:hypothetical protein